MSWRTSALACSLLVLGVQERARALPAESDSPRTRTVLARAIESVRARGLLDRVALLAEPPEKTNPIDVVHVLPRKARASLPVRVEHAPDCAPLVQSIARINAQIEGLARSSIELVAAYEPLLARQVALAADEARYVNELSLAARADWEDAALALYEAQLRRELATSDLPELTDFYESELRLVATQRAALTADPAVTAARGITASIETERSALERAFEDARDRQRARVAGAEEALLRLEAEHEALATKPVAMAEGTLPLFDAEVLTFLAQPDAARRLRFVPAQLENVAFTLEDEGLPRDVPVWLELTSAAPRADAGPGAREPLPGLVPRPGRPGRWLIDERTALRREQVTWLDAEGASHTRDVGVLQQTTPRVRAILPLDAYCGALQRFVVSVAARADSGRNVTLKMEQLALTPRSDAPVETYTVRTTYEVRVQSEPAPIVCTLAGAVGAIASPSAAPASAAPLERVILGSRVLSCRGVVALGSGMSTLIESELKRAIGTSTRLRVGTTAGPIVSSTTRSLASTRTPSLPLCTIDRCLPTPTPVLAPPALAWHPDAVQTTLRVELTLP